jgi:CBS domain-containing protein
MATKASDIMQTHVVTLSPEDPLDTARRVFVEEGIHGAPVVDERGNVVGVVAATDLLRTLADDEDAARPEGGYFQDGVETYPESLEEAFEERMGRHTVADAMTTEIVSVAPDDTVASVARTLRDQRVHRALVMEGEAAVGIISSFDLMELLIKDG